MADASDGLMRVRAMWPDTPLAAAVAAEGDAARQRDIELACACALGQPDAVEEFEASFAPMMTAVLRRMRLDAHDVDEVAQRVREKLLASDPPRIVRYGATGPLNAWIRAVVTREALILCRRSAREVSLADELLDTACVDPEVQLLKDRYREEFKAAFQAAIASLGVEDRNLLRQSVLDGVLVEELAALHGVHRVTVSRRLSRLRAALFEATRTGLMSRLDLTEAELDSVLLLIRSQLEVSLDRVLE